MKAPENLKKKKKRKKKTALILIKAGNLHILKTCLSKYGYHGSNTKMTG